MSADLARLTAALEGRYAVERELGAGGMATVYLAHDVRHDRKVALKVLRPELSAILGAARFLAEIKTTANLQHPHILSLFDSGEAAGTVFYVMPFVEGESLRDRLVREKQLPVDEALRIAREVADALGYAHRHGVVHRDIKPENILIQGGHAMVADFGIALAVSSVGGGTRMTETGMSLGSPHYMSPEQASGEREVTARSDVYALGCVTYEMLAGEPPFTGPTAQAILARVMTEEPRSLTLQRRSVPPHVEAAIEVALEKLPADRYASAEEFVAALEGGGRGNGGTAGRTRNSRLRPAVRLSRRPAVLATTALVCGGLGVAAGMWLDRGGDPERLVRFALAPPDSSRYVNQFGITLAASPDGSAVVYTGERGGRQRLFLRRLDATDPVLIPGTEDGYMPFFSPNGEWLGFVANRRLMKVRIAGGAPVLIAQLAGSVVSGAAWGATGVIVLEDVSGLSRVPADGGELRQLSVLDTANVLHHWPSFLPDGRTVLFAAYRRGAWHPAMIAVDSGPVTVFDVPGSNPRYVEPGFVLLSSDDGTVLAAPFDAGRREFTGPAVPMLHGVETDNGAAKLAAVASLAVHAAGSSTGSDLQIRGRATPARAASADRRRFELPRFSPDGRRVAAEVWATRGGSDVWVLDRARGTLQRLTFTDSTTRPLWSPDGRHIAFARFHQGSWDIFQTAADGTGQPESLITLPGQQYPLGWSPDGKLLVFSQSTPETRGDIWYYSLADRRALPFAQTGAHEVAATLSPDGRWLAYVSDQSGEREVYVRPFPEGQGRWQISADGGVEPRWSRHGSEVTYRLGNQLYRAAVTTRPAFAVSRPEPLFSSTSQANISNATYDVTRDGQEFVFVGADDAVRTLIVTLDPLAGLRRR